MISFFVAGTPAPQGSKRIAPWGAKNGGRPILISDNDKKLRPWRTEVSGAAAAEMVGRDRLAGLVQLRLVFRFPRPGGHYGKGKNAGIVRANAPRAPGKKPDLDKLQRAAFDALAGICFGDDAVVVDVVAGKRWANGRGPGLEVTVEAWHEESA